MTPITVYELNEYVRQRMAEDPILSLRVCGGGNIRAEKAQQRAIYISP